MTDKAGLVELPKDQWRAQVVDARHVVVATHTRNGYLVWTMVPISEAAKDRVGRDDLKRAVIQEVNF